MNPRLSFAAANASGLSSAQTHPVSYPIINWSIGYGAACLGFWFQDTISVQWALFVPFILQHLVTPRTVLFKPSSRDSCPRWTALPGWTAGRSCVLHSLRLGVLSTHSIKYSWFSYHITHEFSKFSMLCKIPCEKP